MRRNRYVGRDVLCAFLISSVCLRRRRSHLTAGLTVFLSGSGKTTQCSTYVLEDGLANGHGDRISILCTQPRRVAAVSVAERVAEEMGESSVGQLIGYSIRGESRKSSSTRLSFCTTGVVLRRCMDDPTLSGISHVVVDEVHERQWQVDLLLVILRNLVTGKRPDLKVILVRRNLELLFFFAEHFLGADVCNNGSGSLPHLLSRRSSVAHSRTYIPCPYILSRGCVGKDSTCY